MAQKIIIQRPSPSGRLNLRARIEKDTSVLKSVIKNWITNQSKLTAVDIIAVDNYCFLLTGSFFRMQSGHQVG